MTSLIERYPEADIVFMTPLHRMTETRKNREPLSSFVNAIREVAEFYSIPVLDLYATAGIQPQLEIHRKKFAPDGLHPNDDGHVKMADYIEASLLAL
jgi:lysophospholipase L1-like esterase